MSEKKSDSLTLKALISYFPGVLAGIEKLSTSNLTLLETIDKAYKGINQQMASKSASFFKLYFYAILKERKSLFIPSVYDTKVLTNVFEVNEQEVIFSVKDKTTLMSTRCVRSIDETVKVIIDGMELLNNLASNYTPSSNELYIRFACFICWLNIAFLRDIQAKEKKLIFKEDTIEGVDVNTIDFNVMPLPDGVVLTLKEKFKDVRLSPKSSGTKDSGRDVKETKSCNRTSKCSKCSNDRRNRKR